MFFSTQTTHLIIPLSKITNDSVAKLKRMKNQISGVDCELNDEMERLYSMCCLCVEKHLQTG